MYDYSKYYGMKRFIKSFLKRWPKIIVGGIVYAKLLHRKQNTHYLVLNNAIGDNLAALVYLKEYRQKNNIIHITAIGAPAYVGQIISFFPGRIDDIISFKRWIIGSLNEFAKTYLGEYLISFVHREKITFTWMDCNLTKRSYYFNDAMSLPLYSKFVLYQIDTNSKMEMPLIPDIDISGFISKYHIKKGNTVFFNIEAKTVKCDVSELCARLANRFIERGCQVVTFTANEQQKPVRGTQAVLCTLVEAYRLAEYGGTVIGVRSGFFDFMVFANCKIICIDDPYYIAREFFKLEKWGVNSDCHTVLYKDDETTQQEIMAMLDVD